VNEFLEQFLIECRELAQQATEDLLVLEQEPRNRERLDSVFRGFHTLKGAAGIVEFPAMGKLLHAAEDVLGAVRQGEAQFATHLIGACIDCLDQVTRWLDTIETEDGLPVVPDSAVAELIGRLLRTDGHEVLAAEPTDSTPAWLLALEAEHTAVRGHARVAVRYAPATDCFFKGEDPLALLAALPDLLALTTAPLKPWPPLEEMDPFVCNLVFTALTGASVEATTEAFRAASGQVDIVALTDGTLSAEADVILQEQMRLLAEGGRETFPGVLGAAGLVAFRVLANEGRAAEAQSMLDALEQSRAVGNAAALIAAVDAALSPAPVSAPRAKMPAAPAAIETAARGLRVPAERVDALVKLTGELTVVKNALGHLLRLFQDGTDTASLGAQLKTQHALMDRHVAELQRAVIGIRVLPLRHAFQRLARLVREMAQTLGKPVRLEIEGDTTEADKAVVEALFEPLLHAVRNAIDHGIELPEDRQAVAKPPTGRICLRAARAGDRILVEVIDDGRGIDSEKIRQVAERRGLATAEALAGMDHEALAELLFAPGFSTAETVTELSGRGVGMDAVRSAIARLGGHVAIRSRAGEGSTVLFTLPFTIMISRLLTVAAAGQIFGVPVEAVLETVRVPHERIAQIGAARAFILRERTVPLIDLAETLGMPAARACAEAEPREVSVVVLDVAGQLSAIAVDRFGERLDVVMKPAEGLLAGVAGIAGTTLLGDGSVLIVLDLQALLG
jgi:two-component system, chemotaxis family, sensor kinase CheA